jgi:hypothetical protein
MLKFERLAIIHTECSIQQMMSATNHQHLFFVGGAWGEHDVSFLRFFHTRNSKFKTSPTSFYTHLKDIQGEEDLVLGGISPGFPVLNKPYMHTTSNPETLGT